MIDFTQVRDYHIFRFSKADVNSVFGEECFQQVIASAAFRRLASIHFLGSIDFLLTSSLQGIEQRQTRFDHSLSVASLAKRFAEIRGITGHKYKEVVVAALLHDIGHAPLSHSLEPAFRSIFELDHHHVGERILRGEVRIGVKLAKVLQQHEINNFSIMSLISGFGDGDGKEIFSRSINADTIDGIIRSAAYVVRKESLISPVTVLDAFATLDSSAEEILDEFWMLKGRVYSALIQSRKGLVADFLCKRYMEINAASFDASYYYGTEKELRKHHGALFDVLEEFGRSNRISPSVIRDGEEISYTRRTFYIDPKVRLRNYLDIDRRYRQRKEKVEIEVKKHGGDHAHSVPEHPAVQKLL